MVKPLNMLTMGKRFSPNVFEFFFAQCNEMLCLLSNEGIIQTLNPKWEEVLGYSISELEGKRLSDIVFSDDWELTNKNLRLAGGEQTCLTNRCVHKDGGCRWIEWQLSPFEGMIYATANITAGKKQSERQLLRNDQLFIDIFNMCPEVITVTRLSDGFIYLANESFSSLLGYSNEDYSGKNVYDLGIWPEPDERKEIVDELMRHGHVKNKEVTLRAWDGRFITCLVSANEATYNGINCMIAVVNDITERKAAEELIKKSDERLKKAQSIGHIGYAEQLADSDEIWGSVEAMKIYGFPPQEGYVKFDQFKACVSDFEYFKKAYYELVHHGKQFDIEFAINPVDGSPQRYIHEVLNIERDKDGKPLKILTVLQDVTDRKKAEDALRKSEEQFKGLTQNIPGMVFQFYARNNGEFGFYYLSDSSMKYIGLENTNLDNIFDRFASKIVEEDRERLLQSISNAITNETRWEYEGKYIKPDGQEIYIRGLSQPRHSKGELIFEGILLDITEQKLAEKALKESEENYRTLVDNMQDAVYRSDLNGILTFTSASAAKILGYSSVDEMLGLNVARDIYFNPEERNKTLELLKTNNKLTHYEVTLKRKDGAPVFIYANCQFYYDKEGSIMGVEGVFSDITEQKNAEQKLKQLAGLHQTIMDTAVVGLSLVKDRKYVWTNSSFCKMMGYSNEELIDASTAKCFTTVEDFKRVGKESVEVLKNGGVYSTEVKHKRNDGTFIWVGLYGKALNPDDLSEGAVWMIQDVTEQKDTMAALLESERNYRDIFNATSDALFILEIPGGKTVDVNDMTLKMYGLGSKQEAMSLGLKDFCAGTSPYTESAAEEKMRLTISEGPQTFEWLARSRSDELFWTEISLTETSISGIKRILGSARNIHERKLSHERFKQLAALNQTLLDTVSAGLIYVKDRKIQWANNSFYKMYGYEFYEVFDKDTSCLYAYEDEYFRIGEQLYPLLRKGEVAYSEILGKKKDGTLFWVNLNGKAIDPDKPMEASIWVIQDITDRRNAESALKKSESVLKATMESMNDGILVVSSEGVVTNSNSRFRDIFLVPDEIFNTHNDDLLLDHARKQLINSDSFLDQVKEIYKADDTSNDLLFFKNGHIIERISHQLMDDSPMKGRVWLFRDITERKAAELEILKLNTELEARVAERTEQLQQANKDLEAFAYSISHDLRAPLRHINGFAKLLFSGINEPGENLSEYYKKINISAKRMSSMIDELLTFSRLGRKELKFTMVDLNILINEIIEILKPDTIKRDIKWEVSALPVIPADQNLLRLAFENLISNAIKYTSKKETAIIEIGVASEDMSHVRVFIKDNGVGFDMAYKNKLFGVFQRLHGSDEFEGIGVGLANVKQIITKHNGSVDAEGKVNEGATFFITLLK
jgi:PAS domain S-box-containing protein